MTGFSALPLTDDGPDTTEESRWAGAARIIGPRWSNLPTLTLCFLGVQLFWSIEMSYASPYLLSLGLSKSLMAMVFLAGPLSGLIVQPLVGILADNSKSRFGRRRPFMIAGSTFCACSLLLLGYTRPVSSIFTALGTRSNDILTIWLAVLAVFGIDFSINVVMATNRALLVDTLPTAEQASGNAWAAMMSGVGGVAGFFVGNIDMTRILPFLGSKQLEVMSATASFMFLFVQLTTSFFVKERVLLSSVHASKGKRGMLTELKVLYQNTITLPRVIRQIFMIQFFSSMAWFPLLFYSSVYVGELYKRASPLPPDADSAAVGALEAEANRLGSRALFYSAVISLFANVVLPFFVREARSGKEAGLSPSPARKPCCQRPQVPMVTLWATSYVIFVGCMAATFFASTAFGATLLIAVTGLSWAISQWAPFSLLAEAILTESLTDDTRPISMSNRRRSVEGAHSDEEERLFLDDVDEEMGDNPRSRSSSIEREMHEGPSPIVRNSAARLSLMDVNATNGHADGNEDREQTNSNAGRGLSAKAGVILGIHNIFLVIPQFLVTGVSSLIFAIFEPHKEIFHGHHPGIIVPVGNGTSPAVVNRAIIGLSSREEAAAAGPNSVAIIFRVGGVAAAVAFFLCLRLARELRHR